MTALQALVVAIGFLLVAAVVVSSLVLGLLFVADRVSLRQQRRRMAAALLAPDEYLADVTAVEAALDLADAAIARCETGDDIIRLLYHGEPTC